MAHPIPFACLQAPSTKRFPARQTVVFTLVNESARASLERIAPMGFVDTVRDAGVKRGNKQPLLTAIASPRSAAAPGGEEMRERGRLDARERNTEYLRIPLDRGAREVMRAIPPALGPVGQPVTPLEVCGQPGATATVAWVPGPGGVGAHAEAPRVLSQEGFARPGGRQDDADGEKHCFRQSADFTPESMNRQNRAGIVRDPNLILVARIDAFLVSLSGVAGNGKAAQGALGATAMAQARARFCKGCAAIGQTPRALPAELLNGYQQGYVARTNRVLEGALRDGVMTAGIIDVRWNPEHGLRYLARVQDGPFLPPPRPAVQAGWRARPGARSCCRKRLPRAAGPSWRVRYHAHGPGTPDGIWRLSSVPQRRKR